MCSKYHRKWEEETSKTLSWVQKCLEKGSHKKEYALHLVWSHGVTIAEQQLQAQVALSFCLLMHGCMGKLEC
eukprot:440305-Pelagomonas_calceolata.AAC.1